MSRYVRTHGKIELKAPPQFIEIYTMVTPSANSKNRQHSAVAVATTGEWYASGFRLDKGFRTATESTAPLVELDAIGGLMELYNLNCSSFAVSTPGTVKIIEGSQPLDEQFQGYRAVLQALRAHQNARWLLNFINQSRTVTTVSCEYSDDALAKKARLAAGMWGEAIRNSTPEFGHANIECLLASHWA